MLRTSLIAVLVALSAGAVALRPSTERASSPDKALSAETSRGASMTIDAAALRLAGVRTAPVVRTTLRQPIRAAGSIRYDATRLVAVNSRLEGWIEELFANYVGRRVALGEPLFTLYSPELLAAQSDYLVALKGRNDVAAQGGSREYADRLVETPRLRLVNWGVPAAELARLERTNRVAQSTAFESPVSGVVIESTALRGGFVERGQTLFKIVDLDVVWLEADFHEPDIRWIRTGADVRIRVDGWPGERWQGRILHAAPSLDDTTRTLRVRVEVANPAGRLKPGMFGTAEIDATLGDALTIPVDALVDDGQQPLVFVAHDGGRIEPRRVTVGARVGDSVQVANGLSAGESVVSRATFLIDSESQLRAALQRFEGAPPASEPGGRAAERSDRPATIDLRTSPERLRSGENTIEVALADTAGPIDDAEVNARFDMPAMPSMNMPAMRAEARLSRVARGTYRGTALLSMGGAWTLTLAATRDGHPIASRQLGVVAR